MMVRRNIRGNVTLGNSQMKTQQNLIDDPVYANLAATQMSAAERESAKRQLRRADSVASAVASGLALLGALLSAGRNAFGQRTH